MVFAKVKFIGSSVRFTTNAIYDVISVAGAGQFIVLDDNGAPFGADPAGPDFQLESVVILDLKQLYP